MSGFLSTLSQAQQAQRLVPKAPRVTETYWEAPLPPGETKPLSTGGEIATALLHIIYVLVGVAAGLIAAPFVLLAASCWWLLTREWPLELGPPKKKPAKPTDPRPDVKEHRVGRGTRLVGRMYDPRGLEVEDTLGPLRPGEEPL